MTITSRSAQTNAAPRGRSDNIETVTNDTFEKLVLKATGPVVAEFMSYGCTHCRALEPVLQEVAAQVESEVTIVRVNVAVEQRLALQYRIQGTPTLVMFQSGREVGRVEGPRPTAPTVLTAVTHPFEL